MIRSATDDRDRSTADRSEASIRSIAKAREAHTAWTRPRGRSIGSLPFASNDLRWII